MCRIFAVRASQPWAVAPAFESLRKLSVVHKDGWGVVRFDDDDPSHHRDVGAAHASEAFHALTRTVRSRSLIAHIREASVGAAHPHNTHPFSNAGWVFCHNGTARGFDADPGRLEARIAPGWRAQVRGDTDSERIFYLFLTLLEGARDVESVCRALGRTVREVAALYPGTEAKPTSLNLLVTDGELTVAARHKKELYRVQREGFAMIASEPLVESEAWHEIPEDHLLVVDADLRTTLRPLP